MATADRGRHFRPIGKIPFRAAHFLAAVISKAGIANATMPPASTNGAKAFRASRRSRSNWLSSSRPLLGRQPWFDRQGLGQAAKEPVHAQSGWPRLARRTARRAREHNLAAVRSRAEPGQRMHRQTNVACVGQRGPAAVDAGPTPDADGTAPHTRPPTRARRPGPRICGRKNSIALAIMLLGGCARRWRMASMRCRWSSDSSSRPAMNSVIAA